MSVQYKTRLNELMLELNKEEYDLAMEALPERLGIGKKMFYKLRTYPKDSNSCMTTDQSMIIAEYFDVSVDYLLGRTEVKSMSQPKAA